MSENIMAMIKRAGNGWESVETDGTDDEAMDILDAKHLADLDVFVMGARHVMLFDRDGEAKGKPYTGKIHEKRIYGDVLLMAVDTDGEPIDINSQRAASLMRARA